MCLRVSKSDIICGTKVIPPYPARCLGILIAGEAPFLLLQTFYEEAACAQKSPTISSKSTTFTFTIAMTLSVVLL